MGGGGPVPTIGGDTEAREQGDPGPTEGNRPPGEESGCSARAQTGRGGKAGVPHTCYSAVAPNGTEASSASDSFHSYFAYHVLLGTGESQVFQAGNVAYGRTEPRVWD